MSFEQYPMDIQRCNISFESWGYPTQVILNLIQSDIVIVYIIKTYQNDISDDDNFTSFQYIILVWLRERRKYSSAISLAQFDLDVNFINEGQNKFASLGKILLQ